MASYIEDVARNPDAMKSQKTLPPDWRAMTSAAVLFTKSLLMGLDHSTRKMEFADIDGIDIENLPFEEAVEYLKQRNVLSADEYYSLSDKMKFRAFTVSRIADGDMLKKVNRRLSRSLEAGESIADFKRWTRDELLGEVGMGGANFSYWETVFRTNVQTAYNVGRAMGFEEDKPIALEFIGIDDARTTDICRELQNPKIILPYDDPFWASHWPPLHFNCRSTVRGIYDESELPKEFMRPETAGSPAKGFGKFPLSNDRWWNELASQAKRAREYNIQGEIEWARDLLFTGARSKIVNILEADSIEPDEIVKDYYKKIRTGDNSDLIKRVSENIKRPYSEVEAVINHVFKEQHRFEGGEVHRFDPDAQIIKALERLKTGEHTAQDILWFNHEFTELTYMKNKKYNIYEVAHEMANKKFNWQAALK